MRRVTVYILGFILLVGAYFLGTFNGSKTISVPSAEWADGNDAALGWRQFVASLEAAGARIFETTSDAQERNEGLAYLAQMASVSLEMKVAKGNSDRPMFTDWMTDYRKFLGDSPDAIYHTAEISAENSYEISGEIGEAEYLGFMLYGTSVNGWNRAAENISSEVITFDSNGKFKIILSKSKPADSESDWLKLDNDIHMVMVRQYFHGRSGKKPASFVIKNINPQDFIPISVNNLAKAFLDAAEFFNDTVDGAIALGEVLVAGANNIDPPKTYNPDFGGVFYPTFDNEYYGSWFYLDDDEALIVEGAVPKAHYWSISLQNRWMQSLDYENFPVALNDKQIKLDNGRYRVVVSHKKPKSGNWLSTTGHKQGLLSIRYQRSEGSEKPALRVVKYSDL